MNHQNSFSQGLYRSDFEHDSCGIGFVANLRGKASHDIIENALTMLTCMEHRGGTGYDVDSGDGAGILVQIPHEFMLEEASKLGISLPAVGDYGVGMLFLPRDEPLAKQCREIFETAAKKLGLDVRKFSAHQINAQTDCERDEFYIASLSNRTLVFKGQFTTAQVRKYYLDLQNPKVKSAIAMFHSRFSTNTFPAWRRAQPFRILSHNGEINTVKGNINWMTARQALFDSANFTQEELELLYPICNRTNSDSANLDMAIELLVLSGRPLAQVMMMVVPEAWQSQDNMDETKRAFYEYYANIMEPWDGPASISFTDGLVVGALKKGVYSQARFLSPI